MGLSKLWDVRFVLIFKSLLGRKELNALTVPQVEEVSLEIPMPKSVLNCSLTATQGKYTFDPVSKVLHWDVGKVDVAKMPNLKGTVSNNKKRNFSGTKWHMVYLYADKSSNWKCPSGI